MPHLVAHYLLCGVVGMVCSHHDGLFCRVNSAPELTACISDIAAYKICDLIAVALCELAAFFHVLGVLCGIINALLLLALVAYFFASFDLSRASAALFFLTSSGDIFSCACFHSEYLSFGILTVNPLRDVAYMYSIIVYLLCVIVSDRRCCFGAHHAVRAHLIRNVRLCRAEYGHFAERGLVRALLPHLINRVECRLKRLRRSRIEVVCALDHFRRNFVLPSHTVYKLGIVRRAGVKDILCSLFIDAAADLRREALCTCPARVPFVACHALCVEHFVNDALRIWVCIKCFLLRSAECFAVYGLDYGIYGLLRNIRTQLRKACSYVACVLLSVCAAYQTLKVCCFLVAEIALAALCALIEDVFVLLCRKLCIAALLRGKTGID